MPPSPKLSVSVLTYNHADFIRKALGSILMQRVSFDYEIVIGDDCSTDGTRTLLEEYQRRWPQRVRLLLYPKNMGMQTNAKTTLEACRGEYIACLEGDDYWTDADKLQTQADYLDQHPDCALCHHAVDHVLWPGERKVRSFPPQRYRVDHCDSRHLAMFNYIQTCSVMFRQQCLPRFDEPYQKLRLGDWPLFVLLSEKGRIGYIDKTMAHYRVHASNAWNNRPADFKLRAMEEMAWYLLDKVDERAKDAWRDTILALAFKDTVLAFKSLGPRNSAESLGRFLRQSRDFKKPFWIFNRLWPYWRANYLSR